VTGATLITLAGSRLLTAACRLDKSYNLVTFVTSVSLTIRRYLLSLLIHYPLLSLVPFPVSATSRMASKQPCLKYQYVVTPLGPKILPMDEPSSKDEESPADYNVGGYLPVKIGEGFKHGRYRIVRKLGYVMCSLASLASVLTCIFCVKLGSLFDCVACEGQSVSPSRNMS